MFADTNDVASVREAFVAGLLTSERLDQAAALLLEELFRLGLFENPYADPEEADRVVQNPEAVAAAEDAHRRSVVLVKNHEQTLPIAPADLQGKKVYVELMAKDLLVRDLDALRSTLEQAHPEVEFTTDHRGADVAIVLMKPHVGSYFDFVGITDLAIDQHSQIDMDKVRAIRESVDTMVVGLNAMFPWLLDDLEPLADALVVGFDTRYETMVEAMLGQFSPTGRLPITFPISQDAIAVDEEGHCASPNDVPGYAKEQHMDGRPYVYVDADGNRYQRGHGLSFGRSACRGSSRLRLCPVPASDEMFAEAGTGFDDDHVGAGDDLLLVEGGQHLGDHLVGGLAGLQLCGAGPEPQLDADGGGPDLRQQRLRGGVVHDSRDRPHGLGGHAARPAQVHRVVHVHHHAGAHPLVPGLDGDHLGVQHRVRDEHEPPVEGAQRGGGQPHGNDGPSVLPHRDLVP